MDTRTRIRRVVEGIALRGTTALALCLLWTLTGCAAPGSKIGRVGFSATVERVPTPVKTRIEITLPKDYGLGGFDRVFPGPEAFGHRDQTASAELSGEPVKIDFPPLVYHITFWLLPPLGAFPRHPPPPMYWVSFSDAPEEIYLLGMNRGQLDYRVYNRGTRQECPKGDAAWQITRAEYKPVGTGENETWHLVVALTKSDAARVP